MLFGVAPTDLDEDGHTDLLVAGNFDGFKPEVGRAAGVHRGLEQGIVATRQLHGLVEPVALVTYMAEEPTEAVMALGLRNVWDAYFAGRAAPLGRDVPAGVVHALFYNFADGEVARHIPRVWDTVTPEAATAARERGSVAALRRILGDLADTPGVARAADLVTKAGSNARTEGRALYAAVRTLPLPTEPVARLWHGANLLREHRGDGHVHRLQDRELRQGLPEAINDGQYLIPRMTRDERRFAVTGPVGPAAAAGTPPTAAIGPPTASTPAARRLVTPSTAGLCSRRCRRRTHWAAVRRDAFAADRHGLRFEISHLKFQKS